MKPGVRKYAWRITISNPGGPHAALRDLQRQTLSMETLNPPPSDGEEIMLSCDEWRNKNLNVKVKIIGRQQVLSYRSGDLTTEWYELLHALIVDDFQMKDVAP